MKHSWLIWTGFSLCLAVVLAAMGWISLAAVRLKQAEVETRRQADLEDTVRLAMWRIDSILAPLVAQESVRPWFCYRPFLPAERVVNRVPGDRSRAGMSVPSPLLTAALPHVLVYFQIEPDGRLTSPQVPTAAERRLAVPRYVTKAAVERAEEQLAKIAPLADRKRLAAILPGHPSKPLEVAVSPILPQPPTQQVAQQVRRAQMQRDLGQGAVEFDARNTMNYNLAAQSGQQAIASPAGPLPPTDINGTSMTPLWIGGNLILARRVTAGGQEFIQGCLLNWPALRRSLLDEIQDLQPAADLVAAASACSPREQARMAAALPIRLIPGPLPGEEDGRMSPIFLSLGIAWACVLLAATAVAGLLAGVMRLSGRRASFVSAVTHELRTPLTTFQMYAEMLADGMVPEGPKQKEYLETLRTEAGRLIHLVENVLAYARLERGRADGGRELKSLDQFVHSAQPRLSDHAARMGMELLVEADDAARSMTVRANAAALEQILFNLVDNACKYAASADDKRIHVRLRQGDGVAEIRVEDHGPGVRRPPRRLFRSFSKSAREAAHSAPGIGLGLALSRRLARSMGGDLRLEAGGPAGACFLLTLPAIENS